MPDLDKAVTDLALTVKSVNHDGVKLTPVVNNFNRKKRNGFDFVHFFLTFKGT